MQPANALNIPAAQFGAEGIAINPKQISGAELVAIGGCKAGAQQRRLDFREDALIEACGG